jgi:hypothetical protein
MTVTPTASKMRLAVSRSAAVAWPPAEIAVAPASTSAGVLGMVRMTACPACRRASMAAIGMPAAIETTSASGLHRVRDLVEHPTHDLRLHRQDEDLGALDQGQVVDTGHDVVALAQLGHALGARPRRQDGFARRRASQEPTNERLGHVARAEKPDGLFDFRLHDSREIPCLTRNVGWHMLARVRH